MKLTKRIIAQDDHPAVNFRMWKDSMSRKGSAQDKVLIDSAMMYCIGKWRRGEPTTVDDIDRAANAGMLELDGAGLELDGAGLELDGAGLELDGAGLE